jgi:hypothetical protein
VAFLEGEHKAKDKFYLLVLLCPGLGRQQLHISDTQVLTAFI